MITDDESTFSANDGHQKFGRLMDKVFYELREKARKLWYQIFFYHGQGSTFFHYHLNDKKR